MEKWGIHWFRRDLRVPGNLALRDNWQQTKGRTLGLFCFDSKFLSRPDFSHNRFAFFMKTLSSLREDLREQGGDLLVVDSLPQEAFPKLLSYLSNQKIKAPQLVTWSRDYEPFARGRDREVQALLAKSGIDVHHERDHLLFEPDEILKDDGGFYQVYSPFGKRWFAALSMAEGRRRVIEQPRASDYFARENREQDLFKIKWRDIERAGDFPFRDALEEFKKKNDPHVTVPIPEGGFFAAYSALTKFAPRLAAYKTDRDFPSHPGTSRLSIYLKNGSLTVPQILQALKLEKGDWNKSDSGPGQYTKELAWREFYYSILYHRPEVETVAFLPQYRNLVWENDQALFARWCEGTTGFPIVDAGMRELRDTGWMHNRVRMIVASFLTKDLLIDWRLGENYFMKTLLDGDLAPNNGGWQWAASTGCDPQPYFRVFNPWLQGKKFDPEGVYIKTFVPELRNAPAAALHDADADRHRWKYPAPIVNHNERRERAIRLYKV